MRVKAQFATTELINGKEVAFFTPPHDQPDFLWVDAEGLARAFLPKRAARDLVRISQNFDRQNRAAETAARDNKIVTIIPHPLAKAMLASIDMYNRVGVKEDGEWGGGPAETAYCVAMGKAQYRVKPLGFDEIFAAYKNQGGPNLHAFREAGK